MLMPIVHRSKVPVKFRDCLQFYNMEGIVLSVSSLMAPGKCWTFGFWASWIFGVMWPAFPVFASEFNPQLSNFETVKTQSKLIFAFPLRSTTRASRRTPSHQTSFFFTCGVHLWFDDIRISFGHEKEYNYKVYISADHLQESSFKRWSTSILLPNRFKPFTTTSLKAVLQPSTEPVLM